uniref:substrate-binding domain-containing protein n=1 Tax=Rhodococcus qingshengii TaxID=334542 RepID=UPI001C4E22E1|nr:substrate-binding domain-containing protein [Rhodococcus qingshengii]
MSLGPLNIGLVVPESGPSGIFGPSCSASAELAINEINARGGILGREVVATPIDGGSADPCAVASRIRNKVEFKTLDALVGWHTSALRREIVDTVGGRIPYVYTAVYEGGEAADGVFTTGEVPEAQVWPALEWMSNECGVRSWFVVGSDYVWPRRTLGRIVARVGSISGILGRDVIIRTATFLPLGTSQFDSVIDEIACSDADAVLILLLGQDAVEFNRKFAERGLHRDYVRLSPLMDENMLLAGGEGTAEQLYSVSGFFDTLTTGHSLDFGSRYAKHFGPSAPPLTSPGESCYEGVQLLAELSERSRSIEVASLSREAERSLQYDSPRGRVRFESHHLAQDVYIAKAGGLDFDIVARVASA